MIQIIQDEFYLIIYYTMSSLQNNSHKTEEERLIDMACSKLKDEDYTHRGFLKPIEIALKTHKTEMENKSNKLTPTSLPDGLKIAVKTSINDNKYDLRDINEIETQVSFEDIQKSNQDNMLSLMKQKDGLELAICICMYSEDKKMLKSTLAGVAQNILHLVCFQKMDPDKIGVFVMMDGILKVDDSTTDYFEELERSNNINLGQNIAPSLSIEQMAKRAQTMTIEQINEQQMKNVNNFLFSVPELQDRNQRRFSTVRSEYEEIKELYSTIQKLKTKKPLYDDLPSKLKPFFVNEARQQRKIEYAMNDDELKYFTDERLIDEYALDIRRAKPLVMKALQQGERYCKQFVESREDLAYLACFRNKMKVPWRSRLGERPQDTAIKDKYRDRDQQQGSNYQLTEYNQSPQLAQQVITEQNSGHNSPLRVPPNAENINQHKRLAIFMNLFLCVKYKNSGKLSSHNWFLNGFCKELRPKYAVLLDVGLRPEKEALVKMYKHMTHNPNVGGVCGYMSLKIEKVQRHEEIDDEDVDILTRIALKFADIQRTQQVEYHFAHLMDKPFEASFGFIHVLPGAFSAYNLQKILQYGTEQNDDLLKNYFKSIDQKLANNKVQPSQLNLGNILIRVLLPDFINKCILNISPDSEEQMLYNQNIFLAEDRILCMGIHKKGLDMAYLPDAYAQVDPIKTVHGLLGQRKRWINGSFFAFEKVKKQLSQDPMTEIQFARLTDEEKRIRKIREENSKCQFMLHLQMFYLTLMNSLSYFAPSFFLFTVHIAMDAFRSDVLTTLLGSAISDPNHSQFYNAFVSTMDFIYVMLIGSVIFFSLFLTNSNKKFKPYIYAVSTLFGFFAIAVFVVLVVDVFRGLINNEAFLIQNKVLIQALPGGQNIINAMRWMLIASTLIYVFPILIYVCMFKKASILCEIIMGAFSFLFYGPTYLNILNIYSICRIDDISWGTKGLDGGSDRNAGLKESWNLLKYVHVGKYVFWNVIVSAILISLGQDYIPRFFVTITMVILIGASLSIKIVVAIVYMINYKLSSCKCCGRDKMLHLPQQSRIKKIIDDHKKDIEQEVRSFLREASSEFQDRDFKRVGGSFIQATRMKKSVDKSKIKYLEQMKGRSKIIQKPNKKPTKNFAPLMPVIQEQKHNKIKKHTQEESQKLSSPDKYSQAEKGEKIPLNTPNYSVNNPIPITLNNLTSANKKSQILPKTNKKRLL